MESYEKSIGLKTIWLTFARRWKLILVIFIPIALGAFLVTNFMVKKTYQSSLAISRGDGTTITTAQHSAMQAFFTDSTINSEDPTKSGALVKASKTLAENNITISETQIKTGLSFASMTNGASSFTVSFTTANQSIAKAVLDAVSDAAIENMHNGTVNDYKTAKKIGEASAPTKNSKERRYLIIALAADLVLALGIPFVQEILDDEVYDKKDIEMLGSEGFELSTTGASSKSEDE